MSAPAQAACVLRFDIFELDIRSGELRKHGRKLRLQGQPIQVLEALLKRPGDLVTREELRAQIWPADTFVDFDHSLHNAIARVRDALGDSATAPRYIETLPRRGYRFIAAVDEIGIKAPEPVAQNTSVDEAPAPPNRARHRTAVAIALFTLAAVVSAFWFARTVSQRTSAAVALRSIAVLPLENLSGDPSQDYFVDGMTEELITNLAKVSTLRVISRTSVMRYKGTRKGLPEIARELNVDGIVEGSVMRSGNRVRVTAQLLSASSDRHLWAESYERDLGDILELQSEVAQAIVQQVRAQLTPQQQARLRSVHPANPEAYEAYLRGRYYMTNLFSKPQAVMTAQHHFEDAIARDPRFALSYSGLADSYAYLAFFRQLSPEAAVRSAEAAIHKALELDDSIGEAHDTLAVLRWRYDWDWSAAEQEFKQAIALAPSYRCSHEDLADFFSFTGRRAEALAEVAKSFELDPRPTSALVEAGVYYQLRDFDRLVEVSRNGVAANPNEWLEHYFLGVGYEGTGKRLEALFEYQKAVEMSNSDQDAVASLAHAYAAIGKRAEARRILHGLEQKSTSIYVSPYMLATMYAGLGENERAFDLLEKAYLEKCLDISWSIKADLRLDNLRSDPRFRNLLRRAGFMS